MCFNRQTKKATAQEKNIQSIIRMLSEEYGFDLKNIARDINITFVDPDWFIVFDEAHKYMDNKDLTNNIVTAIREMRHKGVSIMIASQDPPSLPNEIIELSSVVLLHKFNSPQWLRHIQKSINQLGNLSANDLSMLKPGEGFLWSSKATEIGITNNPVKMSTRPRFTKHGGATLKADRK